MMLIEAMKKLKVIEKRMRKNAEDISRYSSVLSSEKPAFGTEDAQKKEVQSLIQANRDHLEEYLRLKRAIDQTNRSTIITIEKREGPILDFLILKRGLARLMMDTYSALTSFEAERRLETYSRLGGRDTEKTPHIITLYSERDKNENIRKWMDLIDAIDSKLEVINSTTELIEE